VKRALAAKDFARWRRRRKKGWDWLGWPREGRRKRKETGGDVDRSTANPSRKRGLGAAGGERRQAAD